MRGTICDWKDKNFGFIAPDDPAFMNVFIHGSELPKFANVGTRVEFDIIAPPNGGKRANAVNVSIVIDDGAPNQN